MKTFLKEKWYRLVTRIRNLSSLNIMFIVILGLITIFLALLVVESFLDIKRKMDYKNCVEQSLSEEDNNERVVSVNTCIVRYRISGIEILQL